MAQTMRVIPVQGRTFFKSDSQPVVNNECPTPDNGNDSNCNDSCCDLTQVEAGIDNIVDAVNLQTTTIEQQAATLEAMLQKLCLLPSIANTLCCIKCLLSDNPLGSPDCDVHTVECDTC